MTFAFPHISRLFTLIVFLLALSVPAHTAFAKENTAPQAPAITYLTAAQAQQLLEQRPEVQVLDVRTRGEHKRGHIEGAILNNYFSTKFKKRLRALDRNTPYLVHCKSGHRSSGAVKVMQREGFLNIYHLDGGFDAWKKLPPKAP